MLLLHCGPVNDDNNNDDISDSTVRILHVNICTDCYTTLCFKKMFTLLVFTITKSDVHEF